MNPEFVLAKKRKEFGRSIAPNDHSAHSSFVIVCDQARKPSTFVDMLSSDNAEQSRQEEAIMPMNTENMKTSDAAIHHQEGGWPKDIAVDDAEQIARFKKKTERDDRYGECVEHMSNQMEDIMKSNNVIDVFEDYFQQDESDVLYGKPSAKTCALYKDFHPRARSIQHMIFSPEREQLHVGVCYSCLDESGWNIDNWDAYIWNSKNSFEPEHTLKTHSPIRRMDFHPKDHSILVCAMLNGCVGQWDFRASCNAQVLSSLEHSHMGAANDVQWLNSKTNTEFSSAGEDGQVLYWDSRNIAQPFERNILDPNRGKMPLIENAQACVAFDADPSLPTRFLAATYNGCVFNINRKAKTDNDKVSWVWRCHNAPIYALARNVAHTKYFLTVGEYRLRLWAEDVRDSHIINLRSPSVMYTDAKWSGVRPSVIYAARHDGYMDVWDISYHFKEPVLSFQVGSEPLTSLALHENGKLLVAGDQQGTFSLLEGSVALWAPVKQEKAKLGAILEREIRREKALESMRRERAVKARLAKQKADDEVSSKAGERARKAAEKREEVDKKLGDVEEEYLRSLEEEGVSLREKVAKLNAVAKKTAFHDTATRVSTP